MLSDEEKYIIEKLIEFHKKKGGTMSYDQSSDFFKSIGSEFRILNVYVDKAIAIDLIKYKFSDRTGWTVLTKKGWEFTSFGDFENELKNQNEINKITIEKLQIELSNSRRQKRAYWPMTILTITVSLIAIVSFFIDKKPSEKTVHDLEKRMITLDSVVNTFNSNQDSNNTANKEIDTLRAEEK